MDIGTIIGIGKTFLGGGSSGGGGSSNQFDAADFYQTLRAGRTLRQTAPLDPAESVGMPQQITYSQTRQFWNGLLSEYLRS
nr:hypothetical protein [uncultured Mediterranean phage uvMED]|tara:strand:- start:340 stop:582 length:243 start_codon:yes stop_codon:yes gene_type:complete